MSIKKTVKMSDTQTFQLPAVVVLDGGFSSQISCHVGEKVEGDPLWTSRFLATKPDAVIQTHYDFLKAGADIISTNTYQASVNGFVKYLNLSCEESLKLIEKAVELAQKARDKYLAEYPDIRKPLIAGSVGPYGAVLLDGSEYSGNYADNISKQELKQWHIPRIKTLINAGVDLLALETIPCRKEAEVLLELIKDFPTVKAWLTFSCKDSSKISQGDDFQTTIKHCYDLNSEQLICVGANCLSPIDVEHLFKDLNKDRLDNPIPFIVYPNSGEKYDPEKHWQWDENIKVQPLFQYVPKWVDMGIKYIGGCCRTYATDISDIRNQVDKIIFKN